MNLKNTRGFTLIELLVVIAIIGILSSVVLASLNSARQKSRDARRIADVKQLQTALELYYDTNTQYPVALSDLDPTFIPNVPVDPQGAAYSYQAISSNGADAVCEGYHLMTTLEQATNSLDDNDADVAAITEYGASAAACTGATAFAAGADPIYDVRN